MGCGNGHGIGERAGNAFLEELVMALHVRRRHALHPRLAGLGWELNREQLEAAQDSRRRQLSHGICRAQHRLSLHRKPRRFVGCLAKPSQKRSVPCLPGE
jgi:hypothetical protein